VSLLAPVINPSPGGSHPYSLTSSCGNSPGITCRVVWDLTHSHTAAATTQVFLAGPLQLLIKIVWVLVLALAIRWVLHRVIRKFTRRATAERGGSERSRVLFTERRQARSAALGSVLENVASLLIFGIAGITILGDIGINLAPVLASAGVIGIAVGFGAQSLMQDFLAGVFMLMEDQYGLGDMVQIGKVSGVVEGVSLRITRVRDVSGVVWHIRNGTIDRSGNGSQGWARAVVDFPVPYTEDIAAARLAMTGAANSLWEDPSWREAILEAPEIWGVQSVSTDEVTLRVAARTVPLRQWEVERELRERLKAALDAAPPAGQEQPAGSAR
jgi:small-conductance mechanosensitive channel